MIKGVTETIENEIKEQIVGFLGVLLSTLSSSLYRSMLASKGAIGAGDGIRKENSVSYFDSCSVKHTPKEIKNFIIKNINENIIKNIFRTQAYDSIMCLYFCIGFIDFIFEEKSPRLWLDNKGTVRKTEKKTKKYLNSNMKTAKKGFKNESRSI